MLETLLLSHRCVAPLLLAFLCAGCVSKAPAPAETRMPSRVATGESAPAVARPGYYIVKKGDTLYSIAHQHERDYRELAAWNSLDDPNVIKVGQELRVVPQTDPPSTGGVMIVAPNPVIESRPLNGASPVPPTSAPTAVASAPAPAPAPVGQKTEPKGGRVAYSAQAWKDLQGGDKVPPATASAPVAVQSAPVPVKPTEARPAESKPAAGEDDQDWIWPSNGKVLASFNDSSNKGVDIAGNIGDPVIASGAGKVVYVGSGLRGYGNLVIIKHNNNFLSAYAHNSEILVKEGQSVQKGQKIAALGNSDADRPKLHFEIRRQGKPVDPMKYLPTR